MSIMHQLASVAVRSLAAWFEVYAWIVDKSGALIQPKANALQLKVSEIIDWCEANGRPVRLMILKPRQKGCSTVSVGALFRFLKLQALRACIIGSGYKQSANLLKILKVYAENDVWKSGGRCKVLRDAARFANGSEVDRLTANDPEAGRSGTYQVVLATEVARWAEQGVANAAEVLSGLLKTIGDKQNTMVILETTAAGAYGDYYERYGKSVTFEQAKQGKPGYIKIFMPWFVFEDSRRDPALEQIGSVDDLDEMEKSYMDQWDLDLAQMAWFRWALREECNGDFDRFQQDYPSDDVTAFLKSGKTVFSSDGMRWQREHARKVASQFGRISERNGSVGWDVSTEQEAIWMRWEEPRENRKYLVSVDTMTGASETGGDDPDSHGVKVIRAGYMNNQGRWVRPAVVMSLMLYEDGIRTGNWWDIDVLTRHVLYASRYYGNCLIVPEVNMDRGMIQLLKLEGANIYMREIFNKRTSEYTDAYGWETNKKTRPMMIGNLARHIRESHKGNPGEGIEINCPFTIRECESFVRKENGREEAAQGAHDDQVLALAIGLQCLDYATPYIIPCAPEFIPPELRVEMIDESGGGFQL